MVRLFQRHHKRNTRLLDGLWQFKIDPDLRKNPSYFRKL